MSGAIGSTNISFYDLVTAYNNVFNVDLPTTNISLNSFRGKAFTDNSTVPSSGAISIDPHFRSKTWRGDLVAPTFSTIQNSSWSVYGGGTASNPYYGNSTIYGQHGSTATLRFSVYGSGYVNISSSVSSEGSYDFAHVFVNGSQQWRQSGTGSFSNKYYVTNGQIIEFRYYKDGSVNTGSDHQTFNMYGSAT